MNLHLRPHVVVSCVWKETSDKGLQSLCLTLSKPKTVWGTRKTKLLLVWRLTAKFPVKRHPLFGWQALWVGGGWPQDLEHDKTSAGRPVRRGISKGVEDRVQGFPYSWRKLWGHKLVWIHVLYIRLHFVLFLSFLKNLNILARKASRPAGQPATSQVYNENNLSKLIIMVKKRDYNYF
jgi:hypothetical protein